MRISQNRYGMGLAMGVALALVGTMSQGVGWSSHPVGEVSHPVSRPCYGDPPRLTPDPLSPPCVPFWQGNNHGATAPGVTAKEVKVVLYNDLGVSGDLTTPWNVTDEAAGFELSGNGEQKYLVRTLKAQVIYFQNRYETYGRRVRVIASPSSGGSTSDCSSRRSDALRIIHELRPFAFTVLGDGLDCFVTTAASQRVPTVGFLTDLSNSSYLGFPGMVWSFNRDVRELGRLSAAFVCDKLLGSPARLAGDLLLQGTERKFALLFPVDSPRGPASKSQAMEFLDVVERRCGLGPVGGLVVRPFASSTMPLSLALMADLKLQDVTTIVCYCIPVMPELDVLSFQTAASALAYSPEWYFDTAARMYRSDWHRKYTVAGQNSFGITPEWRIVRIENGYPYQAFKSVDPAGTPNLRFNSDIYHGLHLLYAAITTAGPYLTVENVGRGLSTLRLAGDSGHQPIGSLGRGGANTYTFQRGSLAWVWDPAGIEPGASEPRGCLRTPGDLTRDNHWSTGDADLGTGSCMVSHVRG